MGFYGNITNTNRTQFVFDKTYSSRTEMDAAATTDNVFVGRYVLIDYEFNGDYYSNYYADQSYGNSRGFDSTVWQKCFVNEKETYLMIAELNSVVPSFGLVVDAPTLDTVVPHFDADSSNVHYNLHVQPNWGFKIKPVASYNESDEYIYNTGSKWNPELNKTETVTQSYYGDIYYNKSGFDSEYRTEKKAVSDKISFTPTGKTGNSYNVTHNTGEIKSEVRPDTYELSIRLPSIGDTVSALWNIVYGTGDKENAYSNKYRRNKNIDWNNVSGLRLVTEDPEGSGFAYNTEQVETIAGCINSVHDLMGMIISQEEPLATENEEQFSERVLQNALSNRIYYGHYEPGRMLNERPYNGYYRKNLTYTFEEGYKPARQVDLVDFNDGEYYYLNNNNFYLETQGYRPGNKYYTLSNIKEKNLNSKEYKVGTFYYKNPETGDFILETNTWPDETKTYYEISPGFKEEIDASKFKFFFPTSEEYFNKYFAEEKWVDPDEPSRKRGRGLFYTTIDPDKKVTVYKPFKLGIKYQTPLYWIEDYVIEVTTDVAGNTVEVYDFEKVDTVITEYTMIRFAPELGAEYYYKHDYTGEYIKLNSEDEIDLDRVYYAFKDESIVEVAFDFYQPGLYYYKDGNSYILAMENRKYDRQYYTIGTISNTNDILFYQPYKYYYQNEIEDFIMDKNDNITDDRVYYEVYPQYVMEDTMGIYAVGSQWNNKIEQPEHVKLGTRVETFEWQELVGFSRDLNTIHGLILEINNYLKFNDKLTRDTQTVQGCINTVNDIIDKITDLSPSRVLVSDQYGRIVNSNVTTDDWINLEVNGNTIEITHEFNAEEDTTSEIDLNDTAGDEINLYTPILDENGHVVAKNTETITLPFGYKSIKDSNLTVGETVATNTQDSLTLVGDEWIQPVVSQGNITYNHIGPVESNEEKKEDIVLQFGDSFDIEDWYYDAKGHKSNKTIHTITLPENDLEDAEFNNADVITQLSLEKASGKLTSTRTNVADLILTNYEKAEDNSDVLATDTIAEAFSKLQTQIIEEENARANSISDAQTSLEDEAKARADADKAESEARAAAIEAEAKARADADTAESEARENAIKAEGEIRENAIKAVQDLIATEKQARETAIASEASARETAITAETSARETAISNEASAREKSLADEAKARADADTVETEARKAADSAESEARKAADEAETTAREKAISDEAKAREEADAAEKKAREDAFAAQEEEIGAIVEMIEKEIDDREKAISDEVKAREDADAELQVNLNIETNQRIAAIQNLAFDKINLTNKNVISSIKQENGIVEIETMHAKDLALIIGTMDNTTGAVADGDTFGKAFSKLQNQVNTLKQEDVTLNSRCNVLDKEVKGLINESTAIKETKLDATVFDNKVAELEQADVTLNSRCIVLDKEVKELINKVTALEAKVAALEAIINEQNITE